MCELEQENIRLKEVLAERGLELDGMKDITIKVVSTKLRRCQVVYAVTRGLSQRPACRWRGHRWATGPVWLSRTRR